MPSPINLDAIQRAYGWTISDTAELLALTSGDMGYENTGIVLEGDTLRIWLAGVLSWKAQKHSPTPMTIEQQLAIQSENLRLKIALADAIRRPMGVVPNSAEGLISHDDLANAERRRSHASERHSQEKISEQPHNMEGQRW